MCGIYGTTKSYTQDVLNNKLKSLNKRGPDHQSIDTIMNVTLGHTRLSIIDLEARSNQPFLYDHLRLTFNGEIYNFQDVKSNLKSKQYSFRTNSDTEVICAAYLEYGKDCVLHFNGMFSFVIHDMNSNVLFGALDRLGQKPFYYHSTKSSFEFSSDIKAISIGNDTNLCSKGMNDYLTFGFVPYPKTIYSGVKKLTPGSYFEYCLNTKEIKTNKYWSVSQNIPAFTGNYEEAKIELDKKLKDSVKKRLISDVSIGSFLSSGYDSSLISAIAQEFSKKRLNTYTIRFDNKKFDESKDAANIAKYLNTNHTTIACSKSEFIPLIENFHQYYSEPFADASAIPSLLISKKAKQFVTVALTGDGGDEGFIGYERYGWLHKLKLFYYLPRSIRKLIILALSKSSNPRFRLLSISLDEKSISRTALALLESPHKKKILLEIPEWGNIPDLSSLKNAASYDLNDLLTNDMLVKMDRASMAFSLETRSPFLDHELIAFGQSLPEKYLFKNGKGKRIVKDLTYNYIPKELLDRPKKGFSVPLADWFKNNLKDLMLSTLTKTNLESIPNLNVKYVLDNIDLHLKNKIDFHREIWKLIVLIQWKQNNL